jgi:xylose isomerase
MNGASTNPNFDVLACAGTQVKNAIDATIALGGENYVFWGGREGYMSLLNTNMKREKEHLARFLRWQEIMLVNKDSKELSLSNQNQWNQPNISTITIQKP